jgi:LysR family hydrogen peroxide-inducible transcriptional activator
LYKKEKLSVDDLTRKDLLVLKEGHCLKEQTLELCKRSEMKWEEDDKKILLESGNLETLQKLVEQNFGFTLLPYLAVKDLDNKEKLSLAREFVPPVPKREVGLIYSKAFLRTHLTDILSDEILKAIPKSLLVKSDSLIVH